MYILDFQKCVRCPKVLISVLKLFYGSNLMKPCGVTYTIHDSATAKYKDGNMNRAMAKEFYDWLDK